MYDLPLLPLDNQDIESKIVLRKTALARSALAELKGVAVSIPNQSILISTLSLQEAKDSAAIENIITTHDELYRSDAQTLHFTNRAAKEVHNYAHALQTGYAIVKKAGYLSVNHIVEIHSLIENHTSGLRKLPGTELKNQQTGEIVYTPPQHYDTIVHYLRNLEEYINDHKIDDSDPLIKMAIIHHQFESIHPFYDGNGRVGRIINLLYLVQQQLLDIPILYISRYINQHKAEYYRLLQNVRIKGEWQEWILFILDAVEAMSRQTIDIIHGIKQSMQNHKYTIRDKRPKIYSQDLLNNIFRHPYTKIEFVMADLSVSRPTAVRYLSELVDVGVLIKEKRGKDNYYINRDIISLLASVSDSSSMQYTP